MSDEWITQEEAARQLQCSPQSVYRLRRDRVLRYARGRPIEVLQADVTAIKEKMLQGRVPGDGVPGR